MQDERKELSHAWIRDLTGGAHVPLQGQAQQRSVSGASQLSARLTDAFGRSASAVLTGSAAAPSTADSLPPSNDLLVGLAPAAGQLGSAVTPAASTLNSVASTAAENPGAVLPPAPVASHAQTSGALPTSIRSEVAADAVHAAAPSQNRLLPPKPPLHEFVELPGELGILPALPGTKPWWAGLP